jgi:hypothetical protein
MRLIAIVAALLYSTLASAITVSADFSDLWFNPNESGWGANMIQQEEIVFVTIFVYDTNGQPTWFVGPDTAFTGATGLTQHFTGPLYRTTGPYFGAATFNAASVNVVQVGTVSFDAPTSTTGTLTYSVNGVTVTKSVQRQTWRTESIAGSYRGATIGTFTGCPGTSSVDNPNTLTITQTGTSVIINEFGTQAGVAYSCRYTGTLTQNGKVATITGTGICPPAIEVQAFIATNVLAGQDFVTMALETDLSTCRFLGRIGGMREQ